MAPDFRSPRFLLDHIAHTMRFYHPRCIDPGGGFHHFFRDDGTVYDRTTRHLVSSTRFVFNYAMAYRRFGNADYLAAMRQGVAFLRNVHRDPATGGYAWQLAWEEGRKTVLDGDADWLALRAVQLFDTALLRAWDPDHGGICYGYAPDGSICDGDKYFWVQAESLAAAALPAVRTGSQACWNWYDRIWAYSWAHFVDHDHRKLTIDKSPAGKTDYHTMGACHDVLRVLTEDALDFAAAGQQYSGTVVQR